MPCKKNLIDLSVAQCQELCAFCLALPDQKTGQRDIMIYVEYICNRDRYGTILYNVWAQRQGSAQRIFLLPGSIAEAIGVEDAACRIIHDLGHREEFAEVMFSFVNQCEW